MFSTPQTPSNFLDASILSADSDVKPSVAELEAAGASRHAAIQTKLNRRLGPEFVSQRPSPGGGPKFTYVEGWRIIGLANEVFGYNGWSSTVTKMETDFMDMCEETRRWSVGVTAMVKITLKDGAFHEDVGYGTGDNLKSKGAALDKAKKEAVTDATKRALRSFGNLLGLCLYEKSYTHEIVKIKVQQPKFDQTDLHRQPEFENNGASTSTIAPASGSHSGSRAPAGAGPSNYAQSSGPSTPITAVPSHMRPGGPTTSPAYNQNSKGKSPHTPQHFPSAGQASNTRTGLYTPAQTPTTFPNRGANAHLQPIPKPAVPIPQQQGVTAQPIASDRRVSFAPAVQPRQSESAVDATGASMKEEIPDMDPDSYFNSDDDALFAAFDIIDAANDGDSAAASGSGTGQTSTTSHAGASASGAGNRPPSSSSAGGFRFPPGMNPASNRSTIPPLQPQNAGRSYGQSSAGSSSVAGVKRPADAIQPLQRPQPPTGMGLAKQQHATGQRAPLAALQVGDGGDVKRMRH